MFTIQALDGPFGAEINDLDLSRDSDSSVIKRLVDLLHEQHVLIIRNQHLSLAEYSAFGKHWGDPIIFFRESHRNKEFPELIEIHNSTSTPVHMRDYAMFWHSDSAYEMLPSSATLLYAQEAPTVGGETLFVDMAAAYEALPAEKRSALDHLKLKHRVGGGKRNANETQVDERHLQFTEEEMKRVGLPVHPLVLSHPVTGRRALYAVAGTPYGVVGMDDQDGSALLAELKQHATQEKFQLKVKAQMGDILIWDNFATMHAATPLEHSDEDGKRRRMMRISVTGLPLSCRQALT